jgi:hypothetical protein
LGSDGKSASQVSTQVGVPVLTALVLAQVIEV